MSITFKINNIVLSSVINKLQKAQFTTLHRSNLINLLHPIHGSHNTRVKIEIGFTSHMQMTRRKTVFTISRELRSSKRHVRRAPPPNIDWLEWIRAGEWGGPKGDFKITFDLFGAIEDFNDALTSVDRTEKAVSLNACQGLGVIEKVEVGLRVTF